MSTATAAHPELPCRHVQRRPGEHHTGPASRRKNRRPHQPRTPRPSCSLHGFPGQPGGIAVVLTGLPASAGGQVRIRRQPGSRRPYSVLRREPDASPGCHCGPVAPDGRSGARQRLADGRRTACPVVSSASSGIASRLFCQDGMPARVTEQAFARALGRRGGWYCGRPNRGRRLRSGARTARLVVGAARSCCGIADKGLN